MQIEQLDLRGCELIEKLSDCENTTTAYSGLFTIRFITQTGLDRLVKVIEKVASAIEFSGGDLDTLVNSIAFIGLVDESLEPDQLTAGLCIHVTSLPGNKSVVIIDPQSLADASDEELCFVVAHEFGHVMQIATKFFNSQAFHAALRKIAASLVFEQDADNYASRLGFFKGNALKARIFGYPEDEEFQTVRKNWTTLSTYQKQQLAEFSTMINSDWRELATGICHDRRLFTIASLWLDLPDEVRNRVDQFVRRAATQSF